jgi:hypothetical protein
MFFVAEMELVSKFAIFQSLGQDGQFGLGNCGTHLLMLQKTYVVAVMTEVVFFHAVAVDAVLCKFCSTEVGDCCKTGGFRGGCD